ncbi:hypothetical protein A176_003226 [Myxococcus hansupus]|uniref:Uncharacterized protein n=1 Tax=Pseudomyxococcus hansupus TaxID=1297742 RepID=A0A0H4WU31_9BACT|nr:hypothetical protein A176_003226 [Myxococcus hansupus]
MHPGHRGRARTGGAGSDARCEPLRAAGSRAATFRRNRASRRRTRSSSAAIRADRRA